MAVTPISLLLLRHITLTTRKPPPLSLVLLSSLKPYSTATATDTTTSSSLDQPKATSLSARLSFVFDQIDAIEHERAQKHQTLQRIRDWRQSKNNPQQQQQEEGKQDPEAISNQNQNPEMISYQNENLQFGSVSNVDSGLSLTDSNSVELKTKKKVELVHPWPEWIELMERLVQQNYFDHRRKDEDKMVKNLGFDIDGGGDDVGVDIIKDFKTVQVACLNFGKDRFDILRSLSRQDIQILVGYGCPSADKKVVFSAKLLRKHVNLDEGDVCSNCSLRSSCERGYLLTNKEDEARTLDVMRVLLTYGFDPIIGSVVNKSLLKQKSVKTVVRKLLHEVVKLSAVPIDPNLPPPVIKKPPPKVKQPPPPPKKRVGRDDIEMKKGDWLCPKCDFMNFAKNTLCLQCDAKRPKRQLLPGEWECPECNFLNYRRNMACFHCDCKRPPDTLMENAIEERQHGHRIRLDKIGSRAEVSNAWNFDFDDNESDGADVAAFEYADPAAMGEGSHFDSQSQGGNFRGHNDDFNRASSIPRVHERQYSDPDRGRLGIGFDDFDDEDDVDSYELDTQNNSPSWKGARNAISEQEISESENVEDFDHNLRNHLRTRPLSYSKPSKSTGEKAAFSGSDDDELDIDSDDELHPKWKSSHVSDARLKNRGRGPTGPSRGLSFGSDDELELDSDVDDDFGSSQRKGNKHVSGRRNFQRSSDLQDVTFSGSESDNYDVFSQRNLGGNKMKYGRGEKNFRDHADYDFVRDTRVRSKGQMGDKRSSWNDDFDRSSSGSRGENRRFRGNSRAGQRMNDRGGDLQNFKGRQGSQNGQRGRSHGYDMDMDRNFGGFRNSNRQRGRSHGYDMNMDGNFGGFRNSNRQRGRSHGYDMDTDRDFGEFRNSRRIIER